MVLRPQAHVLVVDDDEVARDSARVLLTRWGYRVSLAERGEAALSFLEEDPPDLVLVDLQMPGISGMDVLDGVRERDPAIICVMVTGFATLQNAVDAMKKGAYDFLAKPFSPDELKLTVARGLERRFLEMETVRLRQEKARMEANFVTMVSHQMRSPLAAVRQLLEVAAIEALGPLDEAYGDLVRRATRRLDELLQSLNAWLAMSRIAEDGINQRKQETSLGQFMADLRMRLEVEVQASGQELAWEQPEEEITLNVDRDSLLEALYNVASNAVKYNRTAGRVTVSAKAVAQQVDIVISDQGPGIPEAELPFIFDDFFRSKSPDLKDKPGTGLGLSIAQRVVKAHGGEIGAASPPGQGAVFTVSLPR